MQPDNQSIEQLIVDGELEEALHRFNEFLLLCDAEKDALLQSQARFSLQNKEEMLGLKSIHSTELNSILWAFVTQLRKFRREVLSAFFAVGDREAVLRQITDRDLIMKEILDLRIQPKNYWIEELMTEGNSSIIYRLINRVLNRHAVAMVLKLPTLSDAAKAEIQRMADLRHRNVIKILDHDLSSYPFFVITEFVYGSTLQKALETTGPRPAPQAVDWLYQLTDTLDYLRHKRIYHTNVRPSKIYIDEEWQLMISPLDIHSVTMMDATYNRYVDVCRYASPETLLEFSNKAIKPEEKLTLEQEDALLRRMCIADQYSLGLIGYKMLTGKELFEGNSAADILENRRKFASDAKFRKERLAVLRQEKFHLPGGKQGSIATILERLLEENPDKRYPDLHKVLRALHPFTRADFYHGSLAHGSYRRCLAINKEFIRDFYSAFFKAAGAVEQDFEPIGKRRQLSMLQMAIDVLLDLDNRRDQLEAIVGRQQHQKYGLSDFESFVDVLIETVKRNDPQYDVHIDAEWQQVREKTLRVIEDAKKNVKS